MSTSTSVLIDVIHHTTEVNSKMAQRRCKSTNLIFEHFGPNITTEHNCSQKAVPTLYRVRRFQFNNQLFALNLVIVVPLSRTQHLSRLKVSLCSRFDQNGPTSTIQFQCQTLISILCESHTVFLQQLISFLYKFTLSSNLWKHLKPCYYALPVVSAEFFQLITP